MNIKDRPRPTSSLLRRLPVPLPPSTTAALQSTLQTSFSPDGFLAESVTLSRMLLDTINASTHDEAAPERAVPPSIQRLLQFKSGLPLLRDRLPSLRWYFSDLNDAVDNVAFEFEHLSDALRSQQSVVHKTEQRVTDAVERVRAACHDHINKSVAKLETRDHEIEAAQSLCETLSQKMRALEEENVQLRRAVNHMQHKESEYDKEADMRRSQMTELQTKALVIINENQYLRQICRHNRDLLQEIEEVKEEQASQSEKMKNEADRLSQERDVATREADAALGALRRMTKTVDSLQNDLSAAKDALAASEDVCLRLRCELNASIGVRTPRPANKPAQDAVQGALLLMSEPPLQFSTPPPNGMATSTLMSHATQVLLALTEVAKGMKRTIERQSSLIEYLSLDEFEGLSRGLCSAVVSSIGASELPSSIKKASLTSLVPAPMHSRTVVCQGILGILGCSPVPIGGGFGLIGCRTFSLEEVLLIVDDIRYDRRAMSNVAGIQSPLVNTVRKYFTARNASNTVAAQEAMYSLDYSLDIHRYSPAIDLFRRVLRDRSAPEQLHGEILSLLDQLCRDVQSLGLEELRTGTIGKLTVRFIKRKSLFAAVQKLFPSFDDGVLFRLKAVLQAEMLRLGAQDAKLVASIAAKEEVIADTLIGNPMGDDNGDLSATSVGSMRQPPAAVGSSPIFRRPGSSVMMPFSAAIFRAATDEYDMFVYQLIAELCCDLVGSTVDANSAESLLDAVKRAKDVQVSRSNVLSTVLRVTQHSQTAEACAAFCFDPTVQAVFEVGSGETQTLKNAVQTIRAFYFPPAARAFSALATGRNTEVVENTKVVEVSRKAVNLLRSLQK